MQGLGLLMTWLGPFPGRTEFDTSHVIDKLSFGVEYPGMSNPLDRTRIARFNPRNPDGQTGAYQYFLKARCCGGRRRMQRLRSHPALPRRGTLRQLPTHACSHGHDMALKRLRCRARLHALGLALSTSCAATRMPAQPTHLLAGWIPAARSNHRSISMRARMPGEGGCWQFTATGKEIRL